MPSVPDRYLPGSQYPDALHVAGFGGLDRSTRRILVALLDELGGDVRRMNSADAIKAVIGSRARAIEQGGRGR